MTKYILKHINNYESNNRLQTTASDSYRRVDREDFGKPGTPERNAFDESAKRFVDELNAK